MLGLVDRRHSEAFAVDYIAVVGLFESICTYEVRKGKGSEGYNSCLLISSITGNCIVEAFYVITRPN
jgi:hypothetical protein